MLASVRTVTVSMIVACVFAVRRACVPCSDERNQSRKTVSAANTETAAPPMMTNVAACHISRLHVRRSPPMTDNTPNAAPKTYAAIGKAGRGEGTAPPPPLVVDPIEPAGRDEAAAAAGIGRSLAGYPPDQLVDEGLLQVPFARRSGRTGPG